MSRSEPGKVIEYKGYNIKVYGDESPESPRDWDCNWGTMVCFHKRYNLGDKHSYKEVMSFLIDLASEFIDKDRAERATSEKLFEIISFNCLIFPLYLYSHSGLSISMKPFSDQWDSGQIGYIYITKKKVRELLSVKNLTKTIREKVEAALLSEVAIYDCYLGGYVYGYVIDKIDGEEDLYSCWGYYDYDHEKNGLLESARSYIDYQIGKDQDEADLEQFIRECVVQ
jgi:hypothetical protein